MSLHESGSLWWANASLALAAPSLVLTFVYTVLRLRRGPLGRSTFEVLWWTTNALAFVVMVSLLGLADNRRRAADDARFLARICREAQ